MSKNHIICVNDCCGMAHECLRSKNNQIPSVEMEWISYAFIEPEAIDYCSCYINKADKNNFDYDKFKDLHC